MSGRLVEIFMRHRAGIAELAILLIVIAAASFGALTFDLSGELSQDQRVELAEVLILGVLVLFGGGTFAWRRFAEQEREIAQRALAEDRARHLAHHDHLTGLPNRRELQRELDAIQFLTPMDDHTHAVLLLDLNGFKKVNDVFGHATGDELLTNVAMRFSDVVGVGMLARTGGDEFALVVRDIAGPESVAALADAICQSLDEPIATSNGRHQIGTGVGIALSPADGTQPSELLRKADAALYKSKQTGSRFIFFTDELDREARERDYMHRELARSLSAGTVIPHYQPIVHLDDSRVIAFEALARWTHPVLGEVPPERFIAIAEDSGLINQLTDALLRHACTDAKQWPAEVGLSFNVSPVLLRDQLFPLRLMAILAETGFAPSRLELEITENAIVRDLEAAKTTLGALREAGIKIALDDFGTGATSLFHLRSFKFDVIKIDRSFVRLMATENESAQIVKAVLGLAHGLDVQIIAEGIEDQTQRDLLQAQGCREGQGYLFSRAVPADRVLSLLNGERSNAA